MNFMLEKLIRRGLFFLVFLLPLFFLPLTTDFFDFNKNFFLMISVLLLTVLWALKMILEKKLVFKNSFFDLPVLLVAGASTLSFFFASANKTEALFLPGNFGTILALTLFYFLLTNNLKSGSIPQLFNSSIASAALLGLIALYQFMGVAKSFVPENSALAFLRLPVFSPAGNLVSLAFFLSLNLVLLITSLYARYHNYRTQKYLPETTGSLLSLQLLRNLKISFALYGLSLLLLVSGLGITLYQLLTTAKPTFLPIFTGWVVALEAFKNFPLFGVGVENFVSAFTAGKPIIFNASTAWAARFGLSSNFYLHLLTTLGLLGFLTWLSLTWKALKNYQAHRSAGLTLFLLFALFLFFPAAFLSLFLLFTLLSVLALSLPQRIFEKESLRGGQIFSGLTVILFLISLYLIGRFWLGDFYFYQSLKAAAANNGLETYNLQAKTINVNPNFDLYHLSFSQTNLALANSLASKKDLNETDKQNVNQLVNQAISEAKTAISLAPNRSANWENLAEIYKNLINAAEGADQWTLASFNQAITLDPINPLLRINLGGLYFAAKNYDAAISHFNTAISLKNDYANAHYNLAQALKAKGDLPSAVKELEQTRMLVSYNSNDYKNLNKELEELKAQLPEATESAGTPETLKNSASSTTKITQPVKLPAEAAPPVASPEASPSASPTPTPTP